MQTPGFQTSDVTKSIFVQRKTSGTPSLDDELQ